MRPDPDTCRDPDLLAAEVRRLQAVIDCAQPTLTDAEREAIHRAADLMAKAAESRGDIHTAWYLVDDAATLRGLLERTAPVRDETPPEPASMPERDEPPEWLQRPYYVDPPSGWAYGFPRLYDPAKDGDMVEWMIRSGYPEHLARQGLPCTFRAAE